MNPEMNNMNNIVGETVKPSVMPAEPNTNVTPQVMPVTPDTNTSAPVQTQNTVCPNCGAPKIGKYCTQCGKLLEV